MRVHAVLATAALLAVASLTACSSDDSGKSNDTVTLVTHESFAVSKNVLADFEKSSGLKVRVLRSGDAGELVNKAVLSQRNPQGDVLFGADNTFLSRALDADVFAKYDGGGLDGIPAQYRLDPQNRAVPVDYGDVCVNYDKAYFAKKHLAPPQTFADLAKPAYKNLLVVENPATSSPGLAFVLGSIAALGDDAWKPYWGQLKKNGVLVVDGWEDAYNQRFTVGSKGKGDRPIVVSYASSPPAEVLFADPRPADAPSAVATATCFRQIEFAGVLQHAKNPEGAAKLVKFLLSSAFQRDVPLQMFVFPVVTGTPVPPEFTQYAPQPAKPLTLPADQISKNRNTWIDQWNSVVL